VVEAAPNYGEEWSYNYELRRFGGAEERSDGRGLHIFGRQNNQWRGGTLTWFLNIEMHR
jgi:hypothetical protein